MVFKIKSGRGFSDQGTVYSDKVVGRKLNGFLVDHDGFECFIQKDDIEIISITDEEKQMPIILW